MNKIFSLACLVCLAGLCACTVASPGAQPAQATLQPPETVPGFTALVAEIRASPGDFASQPVEIIGYFRGWDLLGEAGGGPPVTRSDWVIKDNSGAIYVTGALPEGLDPAAKEQVESVVRLSARVVQQGDAVYLEVLSVQVLPDT